MHKTAMCSTRILWCTHSRIIFLAIVWIWDPSRRAVEARREESTMSLIIRLRVLEGEQTSLPCPIDMASREATSAAWFRVACGDPNRHNGRPHHLQVRKVYSLEAPEPSSTTGALEGNPGLVDGSHWKQPSWQGRAFFSLLSNPPALLLNRLKREDSGSYVCNVTYRENITSSVTATVTTSEVELSVAAQPCPPVIKNAMGATLEMVAGPFAQGESARLSCEVEACDHDLTMTWYHDGVQLRTSHGTVATSNGGWKSFVTLGPLRREDFNTNLACETVSNVSLPASATVLVDMFLGPAAVTIWTWPLQKTHTSGSVISTDAPGMPSPPTRSAPFESSPASAHAYAGSMATALASIEAPIISTAPRIFECETSGSRPAADITWYIDGRAVDFTFSRSEAKGNLAPPSVQSARLLECRATNSHLPESLGVMSRFFKMDASHKTEVSVRLGEGLNASYIIEGADVYMECAILAASKVTEVSWRRDGQTMKGPAGDSGEALVISRYLVIRNVNATHSGLYTCRASSPDGEITESAPLELRVRHSPRCNSPRDKVLEATLGETLNVSCDVTADPCQGLRYFWVAEDNAGKRRRPRLGSALVEQGVTDGHDETWLSEIDSNRLELPMNTSIFHSTLLCWARNSMGTQREPCRFRFRLKRGRSYSLDCTVGNYSDTSFSVACTSHRQGRGAGDVGKAPLPRLHVELYDATAGIHPLRGFWAGEDGGGYGKPVFLMGLKPAKDYLLLVRMEEEVAAFATYVRTLAAAQTLREREDKGAADKTTVPTIKKTMAIISITQ